MAEKTLLNIPLVKFVLEAYSHLFKPRKVDRNWYYEKHIPISLSGFSPHCGSIMYSGKSAFADWLPNSSKNVRAYNEGDYLLPEVFFVVHDFLHTWTFSEIRKMLPQIGLGEDPITHENLDDFLFCYVLSETVATVGLDYWYLSRIELNDLIDAGSCFDCLTVAYRSKHHQEFHRFNPDLNVDSEEFFQSHHRFYISGELIGFDVPSLKSSPLLFRWLKHELSYGELQRQFGRHWFNHLAGVELTSSKDITALRAPVNSKSNWKVDVTREIGSLLYRNMQSGEFKETISFPRHPWKSPSSDNRKFDGRFDNLSMIELSTIKKRGIVEGTQPYACYQIISRFDFHNFNEDKRLLVSEVCRSGNVNAIIGLTSGELELDISDTAPDDVFLLN